MSNSKLTGLSIGDATLNPTFNADTKQYTASTSNSSDTITAMLHENAAATLKVNGATVNGVIIRKQPENAYGDVGDSVQFSIVADGVASYQWMVKTSASASWAPATSYSGNKTANMSLTVSSNNIKYAFCARLTDNDGNEWLSNQVVIVQSQDANTRSGEIVPFAWFLAEWEQGDNTVEVTANYGMMATKYTVNVSADY